MVLSGAIGEAFNQENLFFSLASGRFESARTSDRAIHIEGQDIAPDGCGALLRIEYAHARHTSEAAHRITAATPGAWRVYDGALAGSVADVIALLQSCESSQAHRS